MSCFLQWQDLKAVTEEKLNWARSNVVTCKPLTAPGSLVRRTPWGLGSWPCWPSTLLLPCMSRSGRKGWRQDTKGPLQTQGESPGRQEAGVYIKGDVSGPTFRLPIHRKRPNSLNCDVQFSLINSNLLMFWLTGLCGNIPLYLGSSRTSREQSFRALWEVEFCA